MFEKIKANNVAILTTIVSIAATIIVGWLTLKLGSSQFQKAEFERELKVKESVVKLIEQNVINQTPLTPERLIRLIDAESTDENVLNEISPVELIKQAELNLLSSNHLDFNSKEKYKVLFDSIYVKSLQTKIFSALDTTILKDMSIVQSLNSNIKDCKVQAAQGDLDKFISEVAGKLKFKEASLNSLRNKANRNTSKFQLYYPMAHIMIAMLVLMLFTLKKRKWFPNMEYREARIIRYGLMILVLSSIIPFYVKLLFGL